MKDPAVTTANSGMGGDGERRDVEGKLSDLSHRPGKKGTSVLLTEKNNPRFVNWRKKRGKKPQRGGTVLSKNRLQNKPEERAAGDDPGLKSPCLV